MRQVPGVPLGFAVVQAHIHFDQRVDHGIFLPCVLRDRCSTVAPQMTGNLFMPSIALRHVDERGQKRRFAARTSLCFGPASRLEGTGGSPGKESRDARRKTRSRRNRAALRRVAGARRGALIPVLRERAPRAEATASPARRDDRRPAQKWPFPACCSQSASAAASCRFGRWSSWCAVSSAAVAARPAGCWPISRRITWLFGMWPKQAQDEGLGAVARTI